MRDTSSRFQPQVIEIFLPYGDPKSIRRAKFPTQNIVVYDIPRSDLGLFLADPSSPCPALYFLIADKSGPLPSCYIGQTDNARRRLGEHEASRDFWSRALVAMATDATWASTHVTYLEHEAIQEARKIKRYSIENSDNGSRRNVPDTITAVCDQHFDTVAVLLATLGQPVLEPIFGPFPSHTGSTTPWGYFVNGLGSRAHGVFGPEGLVVFKGSRLPVPTYDTDAAGGEALRRQLIEAEVLAEDEDENIFLTDYLFSVPDDSALLLVGKRQQAARLWTDAQGRTYEEAWMAGIEAVMSQPLGPTAGEKHPHEPEVSS
ncbi:GIY-YIG nuclease family protein [Arthrobacter sp. P2b]|uniref:GIY-YIG nuclease family protein n=1 Tax=Arthrobacter sp. P2b TaxID=1938741 RepID=UPI0009C5A87A|nr:GIY-YIG nuclease family protein [Arthrobacter sp. P2b]SLK12052.1 hypothetical protein SAMN06272721_1168 [Arthrobacter sp. P2b]